MPVTMRPHLVVQMDVLFLLLLPFVVKEVAKEVLAADEEAAADVTTAEAEREEAETFGYYPESMGDCSDESLRSRMPIFTNTGMGLQHPLGAYFECLELWSSREKERLDEMRLEREKWSSNTTTMGPYLLLTHEDETAIFSRGDTGITFNNVVVSFLGLALLGIAVSSCFLTARAKRRSDAETEAISRNLAPAGEGGAGAGGGGGGGRRGDRDDGVGVIIVGRESVPQPPPSPQPQPPSPPPPFQPPPQWPPPPTYEEAMMQSRKE